MVAAVFLFAAKFKFAQAIYLIAMYNLATAVHFFLEVRIHARTFFPIARAIFPGRLFPGAFHYTFTLSHTGVPARLESMRKVVEPDETRNRHSNPRSDQHANHFVCPYFNKFCYTFESVVRHWYFFR